MRVLRRLLRSDRSSSLRSQIVWRPTLAGEPSRMMSVADRAAGASVVRSGSGSYLISTMPSRTTRSGSGRIRALRARAISTKRMKLSGFLSLSLAASTAVSKEICLPSFMHVVSTSSISLIPAAVRLVRSDTSSLTLAGKESGMSYAPAKACPSMTITKGRMPIASRQPAYRSVMSRHVPSRSESISE